MTKEEMKEKMKELQTSLEASQSALESQNQVLLQKVQQLEATNSALADLLRMWLMTRGSMTAVDAFQSTVQVARMTVQALNSQSESKTYARG